MRTSIVSLLVASSACSVVFVQDPPAKPPITCTSSSALPIADAVIAVVAGVAMFATTYTLVDHFNKDCSPPCYTPWKPALLASFLVVSPFGISSAVGFSDTRRCRSALRAAGQPVP